MKSKSLLTYSSGYYKFAFIFFIAIFLFSELKSDIVNIDQPAFGNIEMKPNEIWAISELNGNPFGRISTIIVSKEQNVCFLDILLKKLFILNSKGDFIKSFGKEGEGPGEIKIFRRAKLFKAGNKIAIQDSDRIHFFNWKGNYIESKINPRTRTPILFLNNNKFITAPKSTISAGGKVGSVLLVDLLKGKESIITKFDLFRGNTIRNSNNVAAMVVKGLTPMLELGVFDEKVYFGVSDIYTITIADFSGKIINNFSLKRKKEKVNLKEALKPLLKKSKGIAPEQLLKAMAKKLPEEEVYFTDIQFHNGLIYVLNPSGPHRNFRKFDIFSPVGKYLYRLVIRPKENEKFSGSPLINGNYLFHVVLNNNDEFVLKKYKLNLPSFN